MEQQIIPDGYKKTDMGVIPKDWNIVELDELSSANQPAIKAGPFGSALTKDIYVKEGFKIYGQEQVISGDYNFGNYYVDDTKFRQLKSCEVIEGDILLSLVGTTGKLLVIPKDAKRGIINPRLLRFRFDKLKVNSIYFKNLFESELIQNYLSTSAQGGTMAVLNAGILKRLVIPLPALKEQTAIANALSDVDALITSIEKLIAKKQAIKTATMQQLLTGKKRLPPFDKYQEGSNKGQSKGTQQTELGEIPEDWGVDKIENVLSITTGGRNTQDKIGDGKYPFYVRSQTIERINSYSFDGEGVLTAGDGVGTGKIFHYINGKCDIHQRVYLMHNFSRRLHGYYFYIYFRNNFYDKVMSMTAKSSVDSVRREMIADMPISLPSIEEQKLISSVLSDMEGEFDTLNQRLAKTKKIKQGMMQELLTGKTRLPLSDSEGII